MCFEDLKPPFAFLTFWLALMDGLLGLAGLDLGWIFRAAWLVAGLTSAIVCRDAIAGFLARAWESANRPVASPPAPYHPPAYSPGCRSSRGHTPGGCSAAELYDVIYHANRQAQIDAAKSIATTAALGYIAWRIFRTWTG